jgi:hypothetical protein
LTPTDAPSKPGRLRQVGVALAVALAVVWRVRAGYQQVSARTRFLGGSRVKAALQHTEDVIQKDPRFLELLRDPQRAAGQKWIWQ